MVNDQLLIVVCYRWWRSRIYFLRKWRAEGASENNKQQLTINH